MISSHNSKISEIFVTRCNILSGDQQTASFSIYLSKQQLVPFASFVDSSSPVFS